MDQPQSAFVALEARINPHRHLAKKLVELFSTIPADVLSSLRSVPTRAAHSIKEPRLAELDDGTHIPVRCVENNKLYKTIKDQISYLICILSHTLSYSFHTLSSYSDRGRP